MGEEPSHLQDSNLPLWSELPLTSETVQKILDENKELIKVCHIYQNGGKFHELAKYQKRLHENLAYLAALADKMIEPLREETELKPKE